MPMLACSSADQKTEKETQKKLKTNEGESFLGKPMSPFPPNLIIFVL